MKEVEVELKEEVKYLGRGQISFPENQLDQLSSPGYWFGGPR